MPFTKGHKINVGRKRGSPSEETRQKYITSHLGIKYPNRKRPNKFTKEHRKKMSVAQKKRRIREGIKTREERVWIQNRHSRIILRMKKIGKSHTYKEWVELKKKYNHTCPSCGNKEPFKNQFRKKLTIDHIVPLSAGGNDLIENIQPLCFKCNCKKHTKTIKFKGVIFDEYRKT